MIGYIDANNHKRIEFILMSIDFFQLSNKYTEIILKFKYLENGNIRKFKASSFNRITYNKLTN